MGELRIVWTTVGSEKQAREIGRSLVSEKLAACVTVLPGAVSIYHWQGQLEEEAECLLLIKTMDELLESLERRLDELHPYELPEFVALAPTAVSERYLDWVQHAGEVEGK